MGDNVRKYATNATVFREGEVGDWAYLARSGLFEIYTGAGEKRRIIAQAKPGTLFGELALIDRGLRMATVRCIEAGELALIDRPRFEMKLSALQPAQRQVYAELLGFVRDEQPWTQEDSMTSPRSAPERVAKVRHVRRQDI
jgi:CRP-like cAMP-binding protein